MACMIRSVIYERSGLRFDGPTRLTRLEPPAALQSPVVPSTYQLSRIQELLLVMSGLPAASWNAFAHRSRRSTIAVDPPRRLVASGDTCANG